MPWLKRLALFALAGELVWLVVVNGALYLPATQQLVNALRPDRLHVRWERAWTPYPGRFHAKAVLANGETRSQQWQVEAASVSGSLSLVQLFSRRISASGVEAVNVRFRQRPRLRPERDYGSSLRYFPEIAGRELKEADAAPLRRGRAWTGVVRGTVRGTHDVWVMNARARFDGTARGVVEFESRDGPISFAGSGLDLALGPLTLSDQEVFRQGTMSGSVGLDPVVLREHRGLELLQFLEADAELGVDARSLAFLDLFLLPFDGASVGGAGRVEGRVRFHQGEVLEGTNLNIQADDLEFSGLDMTVRGGGVAALRRAHDTAERLILRCDFRDLTVTHAEDEMPLLTGRDMRLALEASPFIQAEAAAGDALSRISYQFADLTVPQLGLLQRYLPDDWPLQVFGGSGTLDGHIELAPRAVRMALELKSSGADLGLPDYRFSSDLDAAVVLDSPFLGEEKTKISGSYLRLANASVHRDGRPEGDAWDAEFEITEGELDMFEGIDSRDLDLFETLGETPMRELLGRSSGTVAFQSAVSSLAWLGVVLGEDHPVGISGTGEMSGLLNFDQALPIDGTRVEVRSEALSVQFMDYVAQGDGRVNLSVSESASDERRRTNVSLSVALDDAAMGRRGDERPGISDVVLALRAEAVNVDLAGAQRLRAEVDITSARMTDMSQFNVYLPDEAPLEILGGRADLSASIRLEDDDVGGWVRLLSSGLKARIEQSEVSADLRAEINLAGGDPMKMRFDIDGSSVQVDNVRVTGEQRGFDQDAWSAQLRLERAQTTWSRPPRLEARALLSMSDSRPFLALLGNHGWVPRLLDRAMTIEDITGSARISLADRVMQVPDAYVTGERVEVGMKGTIGQGLSDGVVFLRLRPLAAVLKIEDGSRNVDVVNARKKFESYTLAPRSGTASDRSDDAGSP